MEINRLRDLNGEYYCYYESFIFDQQREEWTIPPEWNINGSRRYIKILSPRNILMESDINNHLLFLNNNAQSLIPFNTKIIFTGNEDDIVSFEVRIYINEKEFTQKFHPV